MFSYRDRTYCSCDHLCDRAADCKWARTEEDHEKAKAAGLFFSLTFAPCGEPPDGVDDGEEDES